MNLILIEPHELVDQYASLRGARAVHIREVLRAKPGDTIRVGLLDGPRGTARIETITPEQVGLRCTWEQESPQRPAVDLLLALPRPKVMRRLWAQLAALGVGHIALTNAEKVERNYFDTHVIQPATYRPLLLEGLQQAQDTHLPHITIHKQLKPLVEDQLDELFPNTLRLLADPAATQPIAAAVPKDFLGRVLLAIGPEGGWNDFERVLFVRAGFVAIGLGPRTLRTDTACIGLLTLAHATLKF
ncbi:MAG: 16S rRNA (uracil(1498)-N(3))-methyltransferase [Verrucomicrobia bacterium]|nr:MAG: 16S rRNA (uracil(1498)-N(3))-methyltransferase [Verrucomicrobiota bacterium]